MGYQKRKKKPDLQRDVAVLEFVRDHPGGYRHPAFPWGYGYHFNASEFKRAPFRKQTLERLIGDGYITVLPKRSMYEEPLEVSAKGLAFIEKNKRNAQTEKVDTVP